MKVLVSDFPDSMAPDSDHEREVLTAGLPGTEVVHFPYTEWRHEEFLAELVDADAVITAFLPLPAEVLAATPKLRIISINATGYDNVDLDAAKERGIAVTAIGEYCTLDVAEHTIALMLGLNRHLKHFVADIDDEQAWSYNSPPASQRITGQVLGIVGLGKIGSRVAHLAHGLGMKVIATDPFVGPVRAAALGVEMVEPAELFARADVVTNHMNATPDNRGYFDQAAFAAMARRPIFLNTARGSAVVESALVDALDSGQVRAAGLDVLADETPDLATHPLVRRRNVVITPHSAFFSVQSIADLERMSCENVVHHLSGRPGQVFSYIVR